MKALLDPDGHINAGASDRHFEQPRHYPERARLAFHETPIKWINRSRANFNQNFIVPGNGLLDIRDLHHIRRSVTLIDCSFHVRGTSLRWSGPAIVERSAFTSSPRLRDPSPVSATGTMLIVVPPGCPPPTATVPVDE
jgi:hypothetical protein